MNNELRCMRLTPVFENNGDVLAESVYSQVNCLAGHWLVVVQPHYDTTRNYYAIDKATTKDKAIRSAAGRYYNSHISNVYVLQCPHNVEHGQMITGSINLNKEENKIHDSMENTINKLKTYASELSHKNDRMKTYINNAIFAFEELKKYKEQDELDGEYMTREEAIEAYNLIDAPKIEVRQLNAGHDYYFGLFVNDVCLISLDGRLSNDLDAEYECTNFARILRESLGISKKQNTSEVENEVG